MYIQCNALFAKRLHLIYQHCNINQRLFGQNFNFFLCFPSPIRDLDTKKTSTKIEVCPESLGAMLEYQAWPISNCKCCNFKLVSVLFFITPFITFKKTARMPVTKLIFKPINFQNLTLHKHSYMTVQIYLNYVCLQSLCHSHPCLVPLAWLELIILD